MSNESAVTWSSLSITEPEWVEDKVPHIPMEAVHLLPEHLLVLSHAKYV